MTQNVGRNISFPEEARSHRKGECREAGICSCTEGHSSHHPYGAHFKGERPPDWIHVVLVLPADPLVPTLLFQGLKQSQDTDAKETVSGTGVCVPALLVCSTQAQRCVLSQQTPLQHPSSLSTPSFQKH